MVFFNPSFQGKFIGDKKYFEREFILSQIKNREGINQEILMILMISLDKLNKLNQEEIYHIQPKEMRKIDPLGLLFWFGCYFPIEFLQLIK